MRNCILRISLICLLSVAEGWSCYADEPDYLQLARYLSRGDESMMPSDGNDLDIITTGRRKWELLEADITHSSALVIIVL